VPGFLTSPVLALALCSSALALAGRASAQGSGPHPESGGVQNRQEPSRPATGGMSTSTQLERRIHWQAAVGAAALRYARSLALSHNVKPQVGIRGLWFATPQWQLGAELSGMVTTNPEYGVWAASGVVTYRLPLGSVALSAEAGLGVGYAAEILYEDLRSPRPLTWMSTLGLCVLWRVSPDLRWGAALRAQRASVLGLSTVLEY